MSYNCAIAAQQLHSWSTFKIMQYAINPAAGELFDLYTDGNPLDVDIGYRDQWTGYEDAPRTLFAGVRYSNIYSNMSFGGYVLNDAFGPTDYTELQLQYAYRVKFERGENHFLSMGLAFSAMQLRLQGSELLPELPGDPLLSVEDQSRIVPNVALGIHYVRNVGNHVAGGTYLIGGLSGQQLIPSRVEFDGVSGNAGSLDRAVHLYGYAAMRHYYDKNGHDYVEPYAALRYVEHAPLHYDLGCTLSLVQQRVFIGAGISSSFQMQWQIGGGINNNWRILYSNRIFMGRTLAQATGATNELTLSCRILTGW